MSSGVGNDGSDVFRFEVLRGKKKKRRRRSRVMFWTEVLRGKKKKKRRRISRAVFWTKVLRGKKKKKEKKESWECSRLKIVEERRIKKLIVIDLSIKQTHIKKKYEINSLIYTLSFLIIYLSKSHFYKC